MMLSPQKTEVKCEGQLVVLKIGSSEIRMEYETAIQLSTWLRVKGKEAKRIAGDDSRKWTIIGKLDAVIAGENPFGHG
jgi:hypothetical protein